MSTGCQNVSQTGRKIYGAPGRQTEKQNDSMADSRAAKEPALVHLNIQGVPKKMSHVWEQFRTL